MNDLRFALRLLGRSKLFTLTVIATIAIGTGATTTIFSVVNATLLRPLPFRDPDRLVQVAEDAGERRRIRSARQRTDDARAGSHEIVLSDKVPDAVQKGRHG